ncbi:MAG: hypothetical protein LBV18_07500 [Alistipes sp.]|jgi:DNA-binding protein YbaB|nr:hypothetical protein [Alistipes sp.]
MKKFTPGQLNAAIIAIAVLFGLAAITGCEDHPTDRGKDLRNQVILGDKTLDLGQGWQAALGLMDYPVNTVRVWLPVMYGDDSAFWFEFFVEGDDRKLKPGKYNVVYYSPGIDPIPPIEPGDCFMSYAIAGVYDKETGTFDFDNRTRRAGSGTVTVGVDGDAYTIKIGYDEDLVLRYNDELEYFDQSETGTSTFRYGDDPAVYDNARLMALENENFTELRLRASSSSSYPKALEMQMFLTHDTERLSAGTYNLYSAAALEEMPASTLEGQLFGRLSLSDSFIHTGDAMSGSVTIEITGDDYTLTFNDVEIGDFFWNAEESERSSLTGGYTGRIADPLP